jgi:hypothetical protein
MDSKLKNEFTLVPAAGYASFLDVILNDPYVNRIMKQGGTAEMCAVELANQNRELLRRVIELESIAPRKYRNEDGEMMIWRCPDGLVPLTSHAGQAGLPAGS